MFKKFTMEEINKLVPKEKTELYYRTQDLMSELQVALKAVRAEPGLNLIDIIHLIKKVFDKAEVATLIKLLEK